MRSQQLSGLTASIESLPCFLSPSNQSVPAVYQGHPYVPVGAIDVEGMNHWVEDDVVEIQIGQLHRKAFQLFDLNLHRGAVHLSEVEALKPDTLFKNRVLN